MSVYYSELAGHYTATQGHPTATVQREMHAHRLNSVHAVVVRRVRWVSFDAWRGMAARAQGQGRVPNGG
jgi:hypothetical protein